MLNVNAKHRINLLEAVVFLLDAKMVENVHQEPNAFQLLEASATVLVQKAIARNQTVHALMLMNVLKANTFVDSEPNVSTKSEDMIVFARLVTVVMLIMVNALHRNDDAQLTKNVEQMKNAFNPANASVPLHSFWTLLMATNAKILASDTLAASMPNVHHLILRNVCANLDSRAILYKAALMKVVLLTEIHALMELNASVKKEDTNVFVQTVSPAIHIKVDAILNKAKANAREMTIAQTHWHVFKDLVLALARAYFAELMLTANQKNMRLGVGAA